MSGYSIWECARGHKAQFSGIFEDDGVLRWCFQRISGNGPVELCGLQQVLTQSVRFGSVATPEEQQR